MKRKELESQKRAMVESYRNSKMPASRWCEENNVTLSNLRYWISKLKHQDAFDNTETEFVRFSVTADEAAPIVVSIGSFCITLKPGFDIQVFQEAVRILKSL